MVKEVQTLDKSHTYTGIYKFDSDSIKIPLKNGTSIIFYKGRNKLAFSFCLVPAAAIYVIVDELPSHYKFI